jgi:cytochrome P450
MNEALELIQTDDKWRAVRSHLTPILTTGKLKHMNEQMIELADEHVQRLHAILCSSDEGLRAKVDFGQFLPPFAIEMIGKTLCGIKFENVGDPNNQFIKDMKTVLFADGFTFDWTYNWTSKFLLILSKTTSHEK